MKNKTLKICLCLLLALLLVLPLASCGDKGEAPLMEVDGHGLSEGTYRLMLSIQKGNMAYLINYYYGSHDSAEFWNTVIEAPATTNDKYYTAAIRNKAQNLVSASALFDELGLSASSFMQSVEAELTKLVDEFGAGNKETFESVLAELGFSYDDIREYKILNAKAKAAADELYGADGSKISAGIKQEYLDENYFAFRQIYLANHYYMFETDSNGDVIYYDGNGNIAYDTVNGTAEMGDGGKIVYYTADRRVAYDKAAGNPSPILDENGYHKTAEYTYEETLERLELANEIIELGVESEETFEALASLYSDDSLTASNNIYVAKNVSYESLDSTGSLVFLDTAVEKLADMKVGELTVIQDESGLHIVRKYAVEEGAYADKNYQGWFKDSNYGVYDFVSNLKNDLFNSVLAEYRAKLTVDESRISGISLKDTKPNYYYY